MQGPLSDEVALLTDIYCISFSSVERHVQWVLVLKGKGEMCVGLCVFKVSADTCLC